MKNKTPKPRVMWANYKTKAAHPRVFRTDADCRGDNEWTDHEHVAVRVAVIPLDDVEAIVKRAHKGYWADYKQSTAGDLTSIRAALTAAGIPCKRKASK